MGLLTTCIGAYPKPDYVNLPDWFEDLDTPDPTSGWAEAMDAMGEEAIEILNRGTREAVLDQVNAGIDIPTDGEIAREIISTTIADIWKTSTFSVSPNDRFGQVITRPNCRRFAAQLDPGIFSSPRTGNAPNRRRSIWSRSPCLVP